MLTSGALVLVFLPALAYAACTDKDLKTVDSCYERFMVDYGFPSNDLLPAYWTFHNTRTAAIGPNLVNQVMIRKYGRQLTRCLSKHLDCVNAGLYSSRYNQNATDAANYLSDYAITEYQSSARGYELLMHNHECMATCGDKNGAAVDACDAAFKAAVANGGVQACNDHITCWGNVYKTCCGAEAQEYQCGVIRADDHISFPACSSMAACPRAQ